MLGCVAEGVPDEGMKRTSIKVTAGVLLLLLILAIWLWTNKTTSVDVANDWERDGLRGRVAKITTESAPYVNRFGEWLETARGFDSVVTYNDAGQVTSTSRYEIDNSID